GLAMLAWLLGLIALAAAADGVLVEDWSADPVGTRGRPPGWQRQSWGSPAYDFTIVEDDGRRVLHLKSHDENSTITKDVKGEGEPPGHADPGMELEGGHPAHRRGRPPWRDGR